jgi:hypothetical protein
VNTAPVVPIVTFCVFFTQQSFEKRPLALWEGRFFIANESPFDNVLNATEGGIPVSRFPVHGSHRALAELSM